MTRKSQARIAKLMQERKVHKKVRSRRKDQYSHKWFAHRKLLAKIAEKSRKRNRK